MLKRSACLVLLASVALVGCGGRVVAIDGTEDRGTSSGTAGASSGAGGAGSSGATSSSSLAAASLSGGLAGSGCAGNIGTYRAAVIADQPRWYFPLDDAAGAKYATDAGPRDAGVYQYEGDVALGVSGAICGETAVAFDGIGAYGDFNDGFKLSGPFSVELWACPDALRESAMGILTRRLTFAPGEYGEGWALELAKSGLVFARSGYSIAAATDVDDAAVAPALPIGVYTYVVGAYDGSVLRLYEDGELVAQTPSTVAFSDADREDGHDLLLGATWTPTGTTGYIKATIDEVAIYNHALSGAAIKAHFDAATSR